MSASDNFVPNDFLLTSKEIENSLNSSNINKGSTEYAWIRSAISRAYYSAFLILRVSLIDNKKWSSFIKSGKDEHERLRKTLLSLPQQFKPVANDFNNLRKRRNHADYDLPPKFNATPNHVKQSNQEAEKIKNTLTSIESYFSLNSP